MLVLADRPINGYTVGVIDNIWRVGMLSNMKAHLLLGERHQLDAVAFAELRYGRCRSPCADRAICINMHWLMWSPVTACCAMTMKPGKAIIGISVTFR